MQTNYKSFNHFEDVNSLSSNRLAKSIEKLDSIPRNVDALKWCGIRRSSILLTTYIFGYILYLISGAIVMYYLETNNEFESKKRIRQIKDNFLRQYANMSEDNLEEFLREMLRYKSISPLETNRLEHNWSVGQGILYTLTVVTTIGYGHVVPLTTGGKLFTILYSAFGIPFTLIFLSAIVKRLINPTLFIMNSLTKAKEKSLGVKVMEVVFIFAMLIVACNLLPALAFSNLENNWNYLDGLYYTFISLTTIGLGDYIPGDQEHGWFKEVYKICIVVYLLLGLITMSLVAEVYYGIPELNLGQRLSQSMDFTIVNSSKEFPTRFHGDSSDSIPTRTNSVSRQSLGDQDVNRDTRNRESESASTTRNE